jgi:hypothetical protein
MPGRDISTPQVFARLVAARREDLDNLGRH